MSSVGAPVLVGALLGYRMISSLILTQVIREKVELLVVRAELVTASSCSAMRNSQTRSWAARIR